jgi:hypothetical protein
MHFSKAKRKSYLDAFFLKLQNRYSRHLSVTLNLDKKTTLAVPHHLLPRILALNLATDEDRTSKELPQLYAAPQWYLEF